MCDGSGPAIGCPGCALCTPSSRPDPTIPPLNQFAAAAWDRVAAEQAAANRRYLEGIPPW